MRVDDYENLPEGMDVEEVEKYFYIWLKETKGEGLDISLKKLMILGDDQWHSYELPTEKIRNMLHKWLVNNWSRDADFIRTGLFACYCFGLKKELYQKLLSMYKGDNSGEYQQDLEKSKGDIIDPYWSMEKYK